MPSRSCLARTGCCCARSGGWSTARSSSIWRGCRHCRRRWSAPPARLLGPGRDGRDRRRRAARPRASGSPGGSWWRRLCARLMGDVLDGAAHATTTTPSPIRSGSPRIWPPSRSRPACAGTTPRSWPRPGCCTISARPRCRSAILDKPGPLDSGEWHLVQRHPADRRRRAAALAGAAGPSGADRRAAPRAAGRLRLPARPQRRADRRAQPPVRHRRRPHGAHRPPRLSQPPGRGGGVRAHARSWPAAQLEPALFSRYEAVMLDARPAARTDPGGSP